MALALTSVVAGAQPVASARATPRVPSRTADLILVNGRIYTADDTRPRVEAIAVARGRIVFAGSARGARLHASAGARTVDLNGRTVIPGMTDAHAHLLSLGVALRNVDLVGTTSFDSVVARVRRRADDDHGTAWITGRGWDQNDWPDTRFPNHDRLSAAVPNRPVFLTRIDGHAALANRKAMELAGVTRETPDPDGGRIERDSAGNPSGVFVDRAMDLVSRRIPPLSEAQIEAAVRRAIAEANRWGLTGIHDAGVERRVIDVYERLARRGEFSLRNYVMLRGDDRTLAHYLPRGPRRALYGGRLWIAGIKLSADGALGSRGAALLEPYADAPGHRGLILTDSARVAEVGRRALRAGFQLNVHAIGDRANRLVLGAFEQALRDVPRADHRFRVEHAQIVDSADISSFARLDVIPSMQAVHQTSDMYWAGDRLGRDRLRGAYAWRALLNTGVVIPNGSDFPVEAVNPLLSFHAAVTRQDARNMPAGGWFPEQRMTRDEALKSFTIWPAFAAFAEKELGSLAPGKYADFVVLSADIMTIPPEQILSAEVLATWLGGTLVWEKR